MKSIFCSAYAAPIGYYKAIIQSDTILLEQHEHFIKQTIRNRCEISTANGAHVLTIPISQRKNNMPIQQVRICYKTNWQRQHIKTFTTAYQSSPFFEFYIDELAAIFKEKPEYLMEWNYLIHQQILSWLRLNKPFVNTISFQKVHEEIHDYRTADWKKNPIQTYHQVFENKLGFIGNLSILDLIFNCGNEAPSFLSK
jgi:hypothetical protein